MKEFYILCKGAMSLAFGLFLAGYGQAQDNQQVLLEIQVIKVGCQGYKDGGRQGSRYRFFRDEQSPSHNLLPIFGCIKEGIDRRRSLWV
ncbi:MAG: hypothetical protein HC880_15985 [Bacteroidia bacterium]|nr:hypothetical protein [Bacteroidia bacterium]